MERNVAPRRMIITELAEDGRMYGKNCADGHPAASLCLEPAHHRLLPAQERGHVRRQVRGRGVVQG